jgi:hypothetical protein
LEAICSSVGSSAMPFSSTIGSISPFSWANLRDSLRAA